MTITLKDIGTNQNIVMSLREVLSEINRDRTEEWNNYTKKDWRKGWDTFCEGDIYTMVSVKS